MAGMAEGSAATLGSADLPPSCAVLLLDEAAPAAAAYPAAVVAQGPYSSTKDLMAGAVVPAPEPDSLGGIVDGTFLCVTDQAGLPVMLVLQDVASVTALLNGVVAA